MPKGLEVTEGVEIAQRSWGLGGEALILSSGRDSIAIPWESVREVAYGLLIAAERHDKGLAIPECH